MMAGLFFIFSVAIGLIYCRQRWWGMSIVFLGLFLAWMMLWYHATSTLQINW